MQFFQSKKAEEKRFSRQTIAWRKATLTARKQTIRESILNNKATLSLDHNALYKAVLFPDVVPEEELYEDEIDEWIAENVIDFYNNLFLLFGLVSENNQWRQLSQRGGGYPSGVTFYWREDRKDPPIVLKADEYVKAIFSWLEEQLSDPDVFPVDEETPFPKTFRKASKKMFSRLLRVYILIFTNECLYKGDKMRDLISGLKHFLYFGWKWELLMQQEVALISKVTRRLRRMYEEDKVKYAKEHTQSEQEHTMNQLFDRAEAAQDAPHRLSI